MSEDASRRAFLRGLAFRAAATRASRLSGEAPPAPAAPPAEPAPAGRRPPTPFTLGDAELERYARQLALPGWSQGSQLRLRDSNVLVVGAGGLGSPVCLYLAGAGVGRLGVVDDGDVAPGDLHRALLYLTPDVDYPKAPSAAAKLGVLNPEALVEPYLARFEEGNAEALLSGQDLVVECSNSERTRFAVNAACCAAGVPLVAGGVQGFAGAAMSVRPGYSPCVRCAFPAGAGHEPEPGAADPGVLGPAAGVVGSVLALEALRLLGGLEPELLGARLEIDLRRLDFARVPVERDPGCADCGPA